MSATKRVSAIITNYNHGEFLYEAVLGLVKQTRRPDEIIIVDDASTDHSREVLALLQQEHPEIIVILHEKNAGVNAAIKTALSRATGEYHITLGADDPLNHRFFEHAMAVHARHPGIGICSGEHELFYPQFDVNFAILINLADQARGFSATEIRNIYCNRSQISVATAPAIWRRSAWDEVGGMLPELGWLSDWFAALVSIHRHGLGYVPGVMQSRRIEDHSYSSAGARDRQSHMALLGRVLEMLETPRFADAQVFFKIHSVLSRFGFKILNLLISQPHYAKYLSPELISAAVQAEGLPFTFTLQKLHHLKTDGLIHLTSTVLPAYASSLLEMAVNLKAQGRYAKAVEACHKALSACPENADAHTLIGEIDLLRRPALRSA